MRSPSQRKPLAERLKSSLEEGIRHARGDITLKTSTYDLPDEPPEIDAPTIVALRRQSGMSQAVFARLLNVSTKTVQSWEQGVRSPSDASRRLIQVYSQHPETVCLTVGLPPVTLKGVIIEKAAPGHRRIIIQGVAGSPRNRPGSAAKACRTKSKTTH